MGASEITAWSTAAGAVLLALGKFLNDWRKSRADEDAKESATGIRNAKAKRKSDEEHTEYIIRKWQELNGNLEQKVEELNAKESRCQKRLARAETALAVLCDKFNVPFPLIEGDSGDVDIGPAKPKGK